MTNKSKPIEANLTQELCGGLIKEIPNANYHGDRMEDHRRPEPLRKRYNQFTHSDVTIEEADATIALIGEMVVGDQVIPAEMIGMFHAVMIYLRKRVKPEYAKELK